MYGKWITRTSLWYWALGQIINICNTSNFDLYYKQIYRGLTTSLYMHNTKSLYALGK